MRKAWRAEDAAPDAGVERVEEDIEEWGKRAKVGVMKRGEWK